jgi:hypothetical protein
MMTSYRGLRGIVELYRLIRSIRTDDVLLKLRGGVGKLLPQDFEQLRRCDDSWAAPDDESRRAAG